MRLIFIYILTLRPKFLYTVTSLLSLDSCLQLFVTVFCLLSFGQKWEEIKQIREPEGKEKQMVEMSNSLGTCECLCKLGPHSLDLCPKQALV